MRRLALLVVALLALAGCGSAAHHSSTTSSATSSTTSSSTTTTNTTVAPGPQPSQQNHLTQSHCNPASPTYSLSCKAHVPGQKFGLGSISPRGPPKQTAGNSSFGVDFAWGGPPASLARATGIHFGISYLSGTSKDWSYSLLHSYVNAGLYVGFVWETSAARALDGCGAGRDDAERANALVRQYGYPHAVVFFAVDTDTSGYSSNGAVGDYFRCIAHVIGSVRTGAYGGVNTVQIARDTGQVKWFWQTLAWSHGQPFSGRSIYQSNIDIHFHGYDVDPDWAYNFGWAANYKPPPPPDPYLLYSKAKHFQGAARNSEYNSVKQWDRSHCKTPVRRQVCKSTRYHLVLDEGRVYAIATRRPHSVRHPDWKSNRAGSRFAGMRHRTD